MARSEWKKISKSKEWEKGKTGKIMSATKVDIKKWRYQVVEWKKKNIKRYSHIRDEKCQSSLGIYTEVGDKPKWKKSDANKSMVSRYSVFSSRKQSNRITPKNPKKVKSYFEMRKRSTAPSTA